MLEKDLVKTLDNDLSWRRRDIHVLFEQCSSKNKDLASAAIRASVTMMYAHWEGYVKRISCDYLEMVSSKRLRYSNIKPCFRGLAAMEQVTLLHQIKKNIFVASETVEKLGKIANDRVAIDLRRPLESIGNLNFTTFSQIASFMGISMIPYDTKRIFIDESLLRQRNKIAHGEYIILDLQGITNLKDNVFDLLELFRNDVQNAVSTKSYMV